MTARHLILSLALLIVLLACAAMTSTMASSPRLQQLHKITESSKDHIFTITSTDQYEQYEQQCFIFYIHIFFPFIFAHICNAAQHGYDHHQKIVKNKNNQRFIAERGNEYSVLVLGSASQDFIAQCPYCPLLRNLFGACSTIVNERQPRRQRDTLVFALYELSNSNRHVGVHMGLRAIPSISLYKAGQRQPIEMDLQTTEIMDFLKLHMGIEITQEQMQSALLKRDPQMAREMIRQEQHSEPQDAGEDNVIVRLVTSNLSPIVLTVFVLAGVYVLLRTSTPKRANTLFAVLICWVSRLATICFAN